MVKLSEINRTAAIAWSKDALPLLATGTLAGAVDADFSLASSLEIWDALDPSKKEPVAKAEVSNRFNALAWSAPFDSYKQGLLAGAFEDGVILLWDAAKFVETSDLDASLVHECKKHSGQVKTLDFQTLQPHVLASGGSKGEIFIWDTKKLSAAVSPGQSMSPVDEVTSIAWNNTVPQIFASAGNTGYGSIWDLRTKKEVLHLTYTGPNGRANLTSVAWHPTLSTKLVTASDADGVPVILTWDLRNSSAPEKIMLGHTKGVLSIDWCKQDPNLLISSGKDNTTILWNPIEGIKLAQYPSMPNWAFETRFAPKLPEVFATASFDKKIYIQSLQDTSPPVSQKVQAKSDDDFWSAISNTDTQQPEFVVRQAPKWLQCPVGASFGFGGKLVSFSTTDGKSSIKIEKYAKDETLDVFVSQLTTALDGQDFSSLLAEKEKTESKDWRLLEKLVKVGKLDLLKETIALEQPEEQANGDVAKESESKETVADDDFFSSLGNKADESTFDEAISQVKVEGPFSVFDSDESDAVKNIKLAILKGDLDSAVGSCVKEDLISEALVLALVGSDKAKKQAKDAFFKKYVEKSSLARILYSVSNANLSDIVANGDLKNWKEIASAIVSHSSGDSFKSYFVELGDRLVKSDVDDAREVSIACYIAADALDKVSGIWLSELSTIESSLLKSSSEDARSPADARFLALREVVEKVMVYRSISKDVRTSDDSGLKSLSDAYLEFSDLLSTYGHYDLALKLLNLIPDTTEVKLAKQRLTKATGKSAATQTRGGYGAKPKAKNNYVLPSVSNSSVPAGFSATQAPAATPFTPPTGYGAPMGYPSYTQPQQHIPAAQSPTAAKPSLANPYAPRTALDSLRGQTPGGATPAPPSVGQHAGYAPSVTSSPPPPPKSTIKKDVGGWNDLPSTFASAQPRRAPAPNAALPSVYDYQQVQATSQAEVRPPSRSVSHAPGIPPPPRSQSRASLADASSNPPAAVSTPPAPPSLQSRQSSRYAPPPQLQSEAPTNGMNGHPTTATPTPPPVALPSNPYAPKQQKEIPNNFGVPTPPAAQYGSPTVPAATPAAIPPPPKNPYAPKPQQQEPQGVSGYAPPPSQMFGAPPPPAIGTPAIGTPAPPPMKEEAVPPPPPSKKKYPAGDRSHIPEEAVPVFQILSAELEKVKPKIPEKYAKQITDAEKRLNILYDHLNNGDLLTPPTVSGLVDLSKALAAGDYATAQTLQEDIALNHVDECGNWMVGVKRLVTLVSRSS